MAASQWLSLIGFVLYDMSSARKAVNESVILGDLLIESVAYQRSVRGLLMYKY